MSPCDGAFVSVHSKDVHLEGIQDVGCGRYHKYTVSGSPISVWEGDFYAAKGVAMACLATPCGPLHVYNTHTNANYNHVFQHVDIEGTFMYVYTLLKSFPLKALHLQS